MGQIPRSTERISSLHYFCLIDNVVENRQKQPISEVQFKAEL